MPLCASPSTQLPSGTPLSANLHRPESYAGRSCLSHSIPHLLSLETPHSLPRFLPSSVHASSTLALLTVSGATSYDLSLLPSPISSTIPVPPSVGSGWVPAAGCTKFTLGGRRRINRGRPPEGQERRTRVLLPSLPTVYQIRVASSHVTDRLGRRSSQPRAFPGVGTRVRPCVSQQQCTR